MINQEVLEFIIKLLISSGIISVIINYILGRIKMHKIRKVNESLVTVSKVYDILQKVRNSIECNRIVIIKTENGGGIPRINSQIYASILYEVYSSDSKSIKEYWQKRLADSGICKLVADVIENKNGTHREEEDLDGILKDVYDLHDHKYSKNLHINTYPDMCLFVSFIFNRKIEESKEVHSISEKVDYTVNELKKFFSKV